MAYGRTDIHFHVLPGVDDGPETLAESLALAAAAVRDGTGTIVATPHVRGDFVTEVADLPGRVRELKEALAREGLPVSLLPGGELGHDMVGRLRQDELDLIAQGPARRRWLLLETPFTGLDADFNAAADELRDRGFGVVLAHPERSADLLGEQRPGLDHELSAGSALQINGLSLTGAHGPDARDAAVRLLELDLVTAIASDAHGHLRPPALTPAHDAAVAAGALPGVARRLVDAAPRRLMARGLEPLPLRAL
ncbi:MAG: protein-tyrosine phosphatase [Thermoleophilaceae bacterium]|nr:protein-tyrosine phosphatase [Thermoleophilaceae bacterium]